MNSRNLFLIILLFSKVLFPQNYHFIQSIGSFKEASSFYLNSSGFFYITDSGNDQIYKMDTLGNIIKENGGHGWSKGTFDNPSDIFATPLNVYVCDKNNHRIQRFDKDLNFISQLSTRESDNKNERFGYPASCETSNMGDLFILDTENKRILKFDLFGNFILNFGGFDAGVYSLSNPKKFAISSNNFIFVLDGRRIVIFDQYGNGVSILNPDLDLEGIRIIFNRLTVNTDKKILEADLKTQLSIKEINLIEIEQDSNVISSLIFNNKLYILTPGKILIYEKGKP